MEDTDTNRRGVVTKGVETLVPSTSVINKKVAHMASSPGSRGNTESRDDGDQPLRTSKRTTLQTTRSTSQQNILAGARRPPKGRPPIPQHRKNAKSLDNVNLELLHSERQRLTAKLKELEEQFESLKKKKAYEKSSFLMKKGHLMVEIEGLREDKFFLTKKRDKLGMKLLEMHMNRVEVLESAKDETDDFHVSESISKDAPF